MRCLGLGLLRLGKGCFNAFDISVKVNCMGQISAVIALCQFFELLL